MMAAEIQPRTPSLDNQRLSRSTQVVVAKPRHYVDVSSWGNLTCWGTGTEFKFDKAYYKYGIRVGSHGKVQCEPIVTHPHSTGHLLCIITWDRRESSTSAATVTNLSDYDAQLDGRRLGFAESSILRETSELIFDGLEPKEENVSGGRSHTIRLIYRHTPTTSPINGVNTYYDMHHTLGRGAFATVKKALDRANGRWYAVKVIQVHQLSLPLPPDWLQELEKGPPTNRAVKKLLREVTILERLQHENICQLREVFLGSRRISLVLELVHGGNLRKYLSRMGGRMTEDETSQITYQICNALVYIHSLRIAHRDLKLENVLVTLDEPPVVKLADFGLAKAVTTLTELRSECGTKTYLAPEVMGRDPNGYTVVVDSWSLGICAFIMLTANHYPYVNGRNEEDTRTRVTTRQVDWEQLRSYDISERCEDLLRGLLQHDRNRRTTSAAALVHPWFGTNQDEVVTSPTARDPSPAIARQSTHDDPTHDDGAPSAQPAPPRRTRRQTRSSAAAEELDQTTTRTQLTGSTGGTAPAAAAAAPVDDGARTGKRKVQDRSGSSQTQGTGSNPAKSPRGGKKATAAVRAPDPKRMRTRSAAAAASTSAEDDEVPGLVLWRRRSNRLNPPPS